MAFRRNALAAARQSREDLDTSLDEIARDLTAAWVKAWDDLAPEFEATFRDLVPGAPGDRGASRVSIRKDERLQLTMGRVSRSLRDLMTLTRTETLAAVKAAIDNGDAAQKKIIAAQLPKDHRHLAESRRSDLIDAYARASRRIAILTRALPGRIDQAMRRTISRIAMSRLRPDTPDRLLRSAEVAFNEGLSQAFTIASTETLDAYRAASAIGQYANADVLRGWVWLARLDRRTCAACFVMHGSEHPLDEDGPDGHQRCRCIRAPLTQTWQELGFPGRAEPESLISDGLTVFRAMPREEQRQILGPARLDLLDRGDIEWGDLATERKNSGWRRSYVPTPVNQLIEG